LGGTIEHGRMGTFIRFADDVCARCPSSNIREHRRLYYSAVDKLTAAFGQPKIDDRQDNVKTELSKRHAPSGTTAVSQSTNTKYAWEIKDWVVIMNPFDPTDWWTGIRVFRFK